MYVGWGIWWINRDIITNSQLKLTSVEKNKMLYE